MKINDLFNVHDKKAELYIWVGSTIPCTVYLSTSFKPTLGFYSGIEENLKAQYVFETVDLALSFFNGWLAAKLT